MQEIQVIAGIPDAGPILDGGAQVRVIPGARIADARLAVEALR
ncbi:hypothetical protein [Rhodopila globiformis]|nr:hypothetical protein [Rhodopila globiformis]